MVHQRRREERKGLESERIICFPLYIIKPSYMYFMEVSLEDYVGRVGG